ncbi:MAG: amylo-alpha-1,6-glucosidase [Acidobacteriota bacterium]
MKRVLFVSILAISQGSLPAAELQIQRSVRHWEFFDAVGPRAAVLGKETGEFEAWVFPLKLLRNFHLEFNLNGRPIPAAAVARSVVYRPGAASIVYSGDYFAEHFVVRETFIVPIHLSGILIRLQIETSSKLRVDVHFNRDLAWMWPAGLGAAFGQWNESLEGFEMGEELGRFHALVASPGAVLAAREYGTNYSASSDSSMTLGLFEEEGAERIIAIAASFDSRQSLIETYQSLVSDPDALARDTSRFYDRYLAKRVRLRLPDPQLEQAYDWSLLSLAKGLVENPFLEGRGLVAGFGLSKGAPRPGFAWFFGRDTFWSTLALTAAGDSEAARDAIQFIAQFQRPDGKLPHEIPQTSSFVPWFEQFRYAYASADATPLFIIAVADYVGSSGDLSLLRENWERLQKALGYMESTYDANGLARNEGVGHGWVEGGPLLPVRTEFYQAALGVQALGAMARLAELKGESEMARRLQGNFRAKKQALEEVYWMASRQRYAFAVGIHGETVDEPSVLSTVPMWFGLLDRDKARRMIEQLADEAHLSDWGTRIISSKSARYKPAGYHFGSVWPLFSGWASVGQYRYHQTWPALANLKANAHLALRGSGGNTTEVLSGAVYSPLSTSSSQQTWSAAMVVSPLLRGLFGLQVDATAGQVRLEPHLPGDWKFFDIQGVELEGGRIDFHFVRDGQGLQLRIANRTGAPFRLHFAPALSPRAVVTGAEFSGRGPLAWKREEGGQDWHPVLEVDVPAAGGKLVVHYNRDFGISFPMPLPLLGQASSNLKIISETWTAGGDELELAVSGLPGRNYQMNLAGGQFIAAVEGGELAAQSHTLRIQIPTGGPPGYRRHKIRLHFKDE